MLFRNFLQARQKLSENHRLPPLLSVPCKAPGTPHPPLGWRLARRAGVKASNAGEVKVKT